MESDTVEAGWADAARQINDCEYLFAQSIREIEELTLEVIITEAKAQAEIRVREITPKSSSCYRRAAR